MKSYGRKFLNKSTPLREFYPADTRFLPDHSRNSRCHRLTTCGPDFQRISPNGGKGCILTSHRTFDRRCVTELVRETLNQKQFLVVRKILSHAIKHHGKSTEDQSRHRWAYHPHRPKHQHVQPQIYSLWQRKTIRFNMLHTINQQCGRIRAVGQESISVLGALPIVIFMGDIQGPTALADTERASSHTWTAGLAPLHRCHHPRRSSSSTSR